MLLNTNFVLLALAFVSSAPVAFGRELILERDGRPVYLVRRRFGQENDETVTQIGAACPGGVCATIAGKAVSALLAGADPCAQQAIAEELIDASSQFDAATAEAMIAAAVAFRQAEKNTPPDFTANPPALRNSVFCLEETKFAELVGLNQAQDPANDPDLFFDPITKSTVLKGSQANTIPLASSGQAAEVRAVASRVAVPDAAAVASCKAAVTARATGAPAADPTVPAVTVKVGDSGAAAAATPTAAAGNNNGNAGAADAAAAAAGGQANTAAAAAAGVDFGSCTTPEIEFGVGFDNRKETSFQPADLNSFSHGSAQNINIITQFICDTLTNKCDANQAGKDLCRQAEAAAAAAPPKTGEQADIFNGFFGIDSNFAVVAAINDQGQVVAGSTSTVDANVNAAARASTNSDAGAGSDDSTASSTAARAASSANLQSFAGALGAAAPEVTDLGNGQFQVNDFTFNNLRNALVRSCDIQNNGCANAANGAGNQDGLKVADCNAQQAQCIAQADAQ